MSDWNLETFAAIEFNEHVANQAEFNRDYKIYIALARQLAKEAGITDFTLDTPGTVGIKTHNYASATGHGSDHVDPLPFLQKWGVSYAQLKHDIKYGVGDVVTPATDKGNGETVFEKNGIWYTDKKFTKKANGKIKHMGQYWVFKDGKITQKPAKKPAASSAIQQFKNAGNAFTATKAFRVDDMKKVNGIWQAINFDLAGGKSGYSFVNNGIPLDILDNVTRGNSAPTKVGDKVKFMKGYNSGTIDEYDNASNGVGIKEGKYGMVWYNANALLKL